MWYVVIADKAELETAQQFLEQAGQQNLVSTYYKFEVLFLAGICI